MAEKKEKQYVSDNARLMAEWNWEKNNELSFNPALLTLGTHKNIWWKCGKNHAWQATIASRHHGNGCPYCSGKKVIKGKNDLQTLNSKLADEWNYALNLNLTPQDVTANSGLKVWWKCEKGHEWQAVIKSRSKGAGCPECAKEKRIKNKNKTH